MTIIDAASAALADVQAAVASAVEGDTVQVPPGHVTWDSALTLTKAIILKGSGNGINPAVDTIIDNGGTPIHTLIDVTGPASKAYLSISYFRFRFGSESYWNGTAIRLHGPVGWKNARVHHNTFYAVANHNIEVSTGTHSLIDHNNFLGAQGYDRPSAIHGLGNGATDWTTPHNFGSADFLFVEDNVFSHETGGGSGGWPMTAFDGVEGGRLVFRYNRAVNASWMTHDKVRNQGGYSFHAWELYGNDVTNLVPWQYKLWDITAGTGVIFNNTFHHIGAGTLQVPISAFDYKTDDPRTFPACDGNDPLDQNVPGETGWRCQYQVGTHNEGANAVSVPAYIWGNTYEGSPVGMVVTGTLSPTHIQEGRDFYNGVVKPGYIPYTYPHPLISVEGSEDIMAGVTNVLKADLLRLYFQAATAPTNLYAALVTSATAPGPDTNTLGELTEISGNGYTSGGIQLNRNNTDFPTVTEDDTNDLGKVAVKNLVWTASGGSLGPASYCVITDDHATIASRKVLVYWSLGGAQTVSDGQTLTISSPEIQITEP